jgi:hypothetical protein
MNGLEDGSILEEYEIRNFYDSFIIPLFPLLRQGIYHRTSIESYRGIRKDGYIIPNDGRFSFTYPQSEHSYAFANGFVSLFDFESVTIEHCILIQSTWMDFFVDFTPATILLKLDRRKLKEKLIPNEAAPKPGSKDYRVFIPYVEVWYPEPIPLSVIQNYIVVLSRWPNELTFEVFDNDRVTEFKDAVSKIEKQ